MPIHSSSHPIRVALLDDHTLILKGLVVQLKQDPAVSVVGCHTNSREFFSLLATMPVDVAVIDYSLGAGDMDGAALIKTLRVRYPELGILVISSHDQSITIDMMLRAGADGFYAKTQDVDGIVDAILSVAEQAQPSIKARKNTSPVSLVPLSPREREVIRCLLHGLSVTQIAGKYHRSTKTISAQKSTAYKKLGIQHDVELFALKAQILQIPSSS
jgi:two-component system capsular synthesis response regulator RcsB